MYFLYDIKNNKKKYIKNLNSNVRDILLNISKKTKYHRDLEIHGDKFLHFHYEEFCLQYFSEQELDWLKTNERYSFIVTDNLEFVFIEGEIRSDYFQFFTLKNRKITIFRKSNFNFYVQYSCILIYDNLERAIKLIPYFFINKNEITKSINKESNVIFDAIFVDSIKKFDSFLKNNISLNYHNFKQEDPIVSMESIIISLENNLTYDKDVIIDLFYKRR